MGFSCPQVVWRRLQIVLCIKTASLETAQQLELRFLLPCRALWINAGGRWGAYYNLNPLIKIMWNKKEELVKNNSSQKPSFSFY